MGLKLTTAAMDKLWPHAPHSLIDGMVSTSERVFERYGITTEADLADFLAQGSEETGGGWDVEEDLNYSAVRLTQVWPGRFPTISHALPFAHNPRVLADAVYGSRYGNIAGTDDGYNFRGRGFIQVTFRSTYAKLAAVTKLDLLTFPDLANSPQYFLEVGAAFWMMDGISAFANAGNFRGETLRLNGGYTNMPARLAWRATCRRAVGLTA